VDGVGDERVGYCAGLGVVEDAAFMLWNVVCEGGAAEEHERGEEGS
jgi:hypothetical protein